MIKTSATDKIFTLRKRIRGVSGGTSASKTISILLWLIQRAQQNKNEIISVVSETMPHLRKGAMRDFENIMKSHKYWQDSKWNTTNSIYTFEEGSIIEFFSADDDNRVRGPRRDILFINEANNVTYTAYEQLEIRTNKIIWLDWNPVSEFWWYISDDGSKPVKDQEDVDFITLTYKDNEALPESVIRTIEAKRDKKRFWQVYGLGQLGEAEGRIYKDWQQIDDIPHEARLERRGLDFGYTNDPAAIVSIYYYNGGYIIDEELYQRGMHNGPIADFIKNLENPQTLVIADSAEPKSIDEIREHGVNILPARKGKDSIKQGIDYVQDQRISITKRSVNLLKEYRNYLWEVDREGKTINEPTAIWNHCMDAIRYAFEGLRSNDEDEFDLPDDTAMFKGGFY